MERVQKIIANSGYCSRRAAEELIKKGKVKVNHKTITIGDKADFKKDTISIGNFQIKKQEKIYIAINKPRNIITTSKDIYDRKKILDLIDIKQKVFPVGRLDRDSNGLIFLTNDGDWANRVIHPRYNVEKTYYVKLDAPLKKCDKAEIENKIKLSDGFVKGKIKMIDKKRIEITIHVGKNKIVKRIFNHFGYNVSALSRIKIGSVKLKNLKQGQFRMLTKNEVDSFL